jgi:predicted nucleic acid-binding protein
VKPGGRDDDAVYLLDANVLIALVVTDHEHHARAAAWMSPGRRFAVCPVTQGALVRFLLRQGETGGRAHAVLQGIAGLEGCQFWADDLSYADIELSEVRGHRQVTDSYLVALVRSRDGGLLATLDEALSARLSEHCVLLPRLG